MNNYLKKEVYNELIKCLIKGAIILHSARSSNREREGLYPNVNNNIENVLTLGEISLSLVRVSQILLVLCKREGRPDSGF